MMSLGISAIKSQQSPCMMIGAHSFDPLACGLKINLSRVENSRQVDQIENHEIAFDIHQKQFI
jgi:hypothetical protein